ncbi:Battrachocottus baikalensis orf1 and orf2 genes [Elysia marginata]|uniref:Battrachocottus baikalensis orf1 and orf2 genes n=1 Tax=Elysia marginata TaxID=1093978 RepID=A0AAV4EAS9_9GAST|nr:Battrachocottus baikalensis orf1 and orf2 genes [Elysia marginata]
MSKTIITNTGAPQGCVLSPVLYTLYTNDFRTSSPNLNLIKFADDSVIHGFIYNDESAYFEEELSSLAAEVDEAATVVEGVEEISLERVEEINIRDIGFGCKIRCLGL